LLSLQVSIYPDVISLQTTSPICPLGLHLIPQRVPQESLNAACLALSLYESLVIRRDYYIKAGISVINACGSGWMPVRREHHVP
jgi:hypothetical protein